ncbi:unnamed protein product [Sphagnum jensenii]|uniref:Uncharacterized protein n=1 Tax=Sphagnum jensenii TaxID=128206 RepID=A0ABP1BKZ3_9BRYO
MAMLHLVMRSFSLCHPALAICLRYYNRFQKDNLFYYAVRLMTRSIVVFILCKLSPWGWYVLEARLHHDRFGVYRFLDNNGYKLQ